MTSRPIAPCLLSMWGLASRAVHATEPALHCRCSKACCRGDLRGNFLPLADGPAGTHKQSGNRYRNSPKYVCTYFSRLEGRLHAIIALKLCVKQSTQEQMQISSKGDREVQRLLLCCRLAAVAAAGRDCSKQQHWHRLKEEARVHLLPVQRHRGRSLVRRWSDAVSLFGPSKGCEWQLAERAQTERCAKCWGSSPLLPARPACQPLQTMASHSTSVRRYTAAALPPPHAAAWPAQRVEWHPPVCALCSHAAGFIAVDIRPYCCRIVWCMTGCTAMLVHGGLLMWQQKHST